MGSTVSDILLSSAAGVGSLVLLALGPVLLFMPLNIVLMSPDEPSDHGPRSRRFRVGLVVAVVVATVVLAVVLSLLPARSQALAQGCLLMAIGGAVLLATARSSAAVERGLDRDALAAMFDVAAVQAAAFLTASGGLFLGSKVFAEEPDVVAGNLAGLAFGLAQ